MVRSAANVKQTELTRYMKAWRSAGFPDPKVEIHPDGTVVLAADTGGVIEDEISPLQKWRAGRGTE